MHSILLSLAATLLMGTVICRNSTVFNWDKDLVQNSLSPYWPKTGTHSELEAEQDQWALAARENMFQMRSDSIRCATPRPRVIKVQKAHPHASKRYVPSCVALHRCDKEAGCCDNEDAVCSPIMKQRISKYFYVVTLGQLNGVTPVGIYGKVERLRFTNHTQCGCRKRKSGQYVPKQAPSINSANTHYLASSSIFTALLVRVLVLC